jgi:microcystin-dependent protein
VPTTYTDQVLGVVSGVPAWVEPTPAGTLRQTIKTTADAGWLLMGNGATVLVTNCEQQYPALFAAAPAGWISGTVGTRNVTLPDMTNRLTIGAGTAASVGVSGGSNTATIGTTHLPSHAHAIDHDHASFSHSVDANTTDLVTREATFTTGGFASGKYSATFTNPLLALGSNPASAADVLAGMAQNFITDHTHTSTVDVPAFTGTGGSTGGGTALPIVPAVLGIIWQIKAH